MLSVLVGGCGAESSRTADVSLPTPADASRMPTSTVSTTTTTTVLDRSTVQAPRTPTLEEILLPEGSLPVVEINVEAGESVATTDLPPGHYRVRVLPYQAHWPEVCLGESIVAEPIRGGTITVPEVAASADQIQRADEEARELAQAQRRALEPVCGTYWSELDGRTDLPIPDRPTVSVPVGLSTTTIG